MLKKNQTEKKSASQVGHYLSGRQVTLLVYGLQRGPPGPGTAGPVLGDGDLRGGRVVHHLLQPQPGRVLRRLRGDDGGAGHLGGPVRLPGGGGGEARQVGRRQRRAQALHGEGGVDGAELELLVRGQRGESRAEAEARAARVDVDEEVARRVHHQLRRRRRQRHLPDAAVREYHPRALAAGPRPRRLGQRARQVVAHGRSTRALGESESVLPGCEN
uniref:Uncharacterized protein n=1 Tax=Zea mays TaxID=4577 RepID=A0A804QN38_MAIZE